MAGALQVLNVARRILASELSSPFLSLTNNVISSYNLNQENSRVQERKAVGRPGSME
jgi:hypothetical protein